MNFRNQFSGSRRINRTFASIPLTYNSSGGLQVFANDISDSNPGAFASATRPIAIGHSMGGAALRRLDFSTDLGDIITVGAPLDGAGVATAVNNGSGTAEIQNGVNQVGRGPIADFLPVGVRGIIVTDIIDVVRATGGVVTGRTFNNPLAFTPNAFGVASVNDLQIGGGIAADTNNAPTARPKISIFGNLSSPVHWKMATEAIRFLGTAPSALANVDLADAASRAEDIYHVVHVIHTTIAISFTAGGFFQPWLWWIAAIEFWKAGEWKAGRDWFRDSERIWNVIIASDVPAATQSQY